MYFIEIVINFFPCGLNLVNVPKRPKTQQSVGKVMASVFWDAHGVIFIDYLDKGRKITFFFSEEKRECIYARCVGLGQSNTH